MKLNFVISNGMQSKIFQAIFAYFKAYLPTEIELYITYRPCPGMDIYHYHRPHLEKIFKPMSVVTLHHALNDTDPWFDKINVNQHIVSVKKIVCLNQSQLDFLHKQGIYQTELIPHGVNKDIFKRQKRRMPEGRLQIGLISKRYTRRVKGEAYLFELIKRLNPMKVAFCLIGEGREVEYHRLIDMGFEVIFYESIPYAQFNQLYQFIDILLVPSLYEGGPASIPEALYTRTPVVARAVGMIPDVLINGENGYYLSEDLQHDEQLIHALADNKNNIMTDLIKKMNRTKAAVYSWEDVVTVHVITYESMLGAERCA